MTDDTQLRFVGVTKFQFLVTGFAVFAILTAIMVILLAFGLNDISRSVSASDRRANAAEAQVTAAREIVTEDKVALCGLKRNADDQATETANFLATHPEKILLGSIPRAEIIQTLHREQTFAHTLVGLTCP